MDKIDLLLVNPSDKKQMYGELGPSIPGVEPPLWTGLIAGFVRERGFSVRIIDADAEGWDPEYTAEKILASNPLLVGIGALGANPSASSTPKMAAAGRILNNLKAKSPEIKTVLYGIHPSALPERTLREEKADFVCCGESFYTIPELLGTLKSTDKIIDNKIKGLWYMKDNKVVSNGWGRLLQNLDELPFIAWDLLPMDKYKAHNWHCFHHLDQRQPYAVIYTSLGCPFDCTYCNIHTFYGGKPGIRFRSLEKVVEEIDFLVNNYHIKNIKIIDEIFVLNQSRVMKFCDSIIQRGYDLNMWGYARIDTVNEKVLKKMKRAGISWLCYGIESGNRKVRAGVSKGRFGKDAVRRAIQMTKAAGICILGNFMFGLPDDNLETMQETLELAKELNCEYANFYTTMAYPGSRLYALALKDDLRLPDSWLGYAQFSEETFPLPTKYLSNAEVLTFRDKAFYDYHSNPRYLKMIEEKFGPQVVEHLKEVLKHKLRRKLSCNMEIQKNTDVT